MNEEKKTETKKNKINNVVSGIKSVTNKTLNNLKGYKVLGIVLVIIILLVLLSNLGKKDTPYPVIYNNSDGDLYLATTKVKKEDKAVKLSSGDSVNGILYANTTDKYVLFEKNEDLYLYNEKSKDVTTKIVSNVVDYFITDDDSYVIALDDEDTLYSYNFKKEKQKLDSDVSSIEGYTNDKVLYERDGILYVRSLKASKDDRTKVTDNHDDNISFSKDGKKVIYINEDDELVIFNIKKGEGEKIASDVSTYYCDSKSCDKLYYVVLDSNKVLYYYNGKDGEKITEDIYSINSYDVDNQIVLYTKYNKDDKNYTLYYQNGTKDAIEVENKLSGLRTVRLFEEKDVYYITSDNELKYVELKGNKIGNVKSLKEDVAGYLYLTKEGYAFVSETDDNDNGTLYLASNGKIKEIDDNVNNNIISVSKSGKKVYYMKDYNNSGDLYVTSGGKGKKIDSDIRLFEYINDKLIYIIKNYSTTKSRGDLYRYNGNKSIKIAENVTRIASSPVHYVEK